MLPVPAPHIPVQTACRSPVCASRQPPSSRIAADNPPSAVSNPSSAAARAAGSGLVLVSARGSSKPIATLVSPTIDRSGDRHGSRHLAEVTVGGP